MANMRCVQVSRPNGPFELVERQIADPRAGTVRIKVQACGICHSDSFTKEGTFPGVHESEWRRVLCESATQTDEAIDSVYVAIPVLLVVISTIQIAAASVP